MKTVKLFFVLISFLFLHTSCEKDESKPNTNLKSINVTSTTTSDEIDLSWAPVAGVNWYKISIGKKGQTLSQIENFQNLTDNPITYEIDNLDANTAYDVKIDGTDYASGGKVIATKSLSVTTKP